LLALVVAATTGSGRAAFGQTLEEALAAAYQNNPTLEAARAALRAVDERVPQALSGWRPTVTATGDLGRSSVESETAFFSAEEERTPKNYRLTFAQPLYRGGRTVAGTRRAENEVESERARLRTTEQDVLLRAATAFMDVLREQAVLRLNIGNEQVLRRQLEATMDQFEVGEVTRTDVSQAEARLARTTADRIQAEGDLESVRAVYRNVIGAEAGELVSPGPVTALPASLEEATGASEQNPELVAAAFAEKAALDNVRVVTGELLPTVTLSGELAQSRDASTRGSFNEVAELTAELRVPLYQSGAVYSRVREARQTAMERRSEVEEARRNAGEAATRAWEALQTARARTASFETEIRANEIALEGVKQEATVGARTILDILDAEQELLDSRVSLVRAQRDENSYYNKVRGKFWGTGIDGD
jgi:TolC family type I secretion outer membrane protein